MAVVALLFPWRLSKEAVVKDSQAQLDVDGSRVGATTSISRWSSRSSPVTAASRAAEGCRYGSCV